MLEADESAMKKWKVESTKGGFRFFPDVWIGVVGRGSRKTFLHHVGRRSARAYKRFPKIKGYIWVDLWKRFFRKKSTTSVQ